MSDPTVIEGQLEHSASEEPDSPLSRAPKKRERLEFALPTINIIFLLMLYFLVAGTIVQKDELSVTPPETSKVPTDRLPRPLLVVSGPGAYALDGRVLQPAELTVAAQDAVAHAQSGSLHILAAAEMGAGPFLEILATLSAASVPVQIVTVEKGTGEAAATP